MKRFLTILIVVNLVVIFHEAGHYLAMRSLGLQVEEISLGMGWKLLEIGHLDGAAVNIRALPVGGYVASEEYGHLHENGWTGALGSSWVAFAGPLGNIVFAGLAVLSPFMLLLLIAALKGRKITGLSQIVIPALTLPFLLLKAIFAIPASFIWGLCTHPIRTLDGIRGPLYIFFSKNDVLGVGGNRETENGGQTAGGDGETGAAPKQGTIERVQNMVRPLMTFSLAIGGLNLIPLLPFDGGHIVMAAIQLALGGAAAGVFVTVSIWPIFALLGIVVIGDILHLIYEARSKKTN